MREIVENCHIFGIVLSEFLRNQNGLLGIAGIVEVDFLKLEGHRIFNNGKREVDRLPGFLGFVTLEQRFDLHLPGGFIFGICFENSISLPDSLGQFLLCQQRMGNAFFVENISGIELAGFAQTLDGDLVLTELLVDDRE